MNTFRLVVSALFLLAFYSTGQSQAIQKRGLSLEGAKQVIAAAVADAMRKGTPGAAIAVVDGGGNLIAAERFDSTFAAGANGDGEVIGAIGVSGAASAEQDEELAIAGANALAWTSAQAR